MKATLSEREINQIRLARWQCRTDLGFLCREVLNYKDVDDYVHGPIMRTLQPFPKPSKQQFTENDQYINGKWEYTPVFKHVQDIPGKRRRLILAQRGLMKCACKTELIRTKEGTYKQAQHLVVGDEIAGQLSENDFTYGYTKVTAVENQPLQPGYRLTFQSGRILEVSHAHPLRTIEGWVNAENAVVGTRIAIQGLSPEPEEAKEVADAELIGWFIGDGHCPGSNITNIDPYFLERITRLCETLGYPSKIRTYKDRATRVLVREYRPRMRELGIAKCVSGDKFVPEEIFKACNTSVAAFLYGLFMADGCMGKDFCYLTTKSPRLAQDVQKLLLRFNIWSVVKCHMVKYKGEKRPYWVCRISSTPQMQRFIDAIGWDKLSRFVSKKSNPNTNTVPREWRKRFGKYFFSRGQRPKDLQSKGLCFAHYDISKDKLRPFAKALGDTELEYLCSDAIYWDTVKGVEALGDIETVGIETESKTLAINDIVTHNTTLNLQAHTIQWIINYPSVAMAIFQSNLDKSEAILKEIRHHFKFNEVFRRIFPEHCPQGTGTYIENWGLKSELTTCARPKTISRREPTIMALSIDKENAGWHFDVLKFSDIVEPETTKTDTAIENTKRAFSLADSLLVSMPYWIDVEGTRYTANDLYQKLIDDWSAEEAKSQPHEYDILIQGCFKLKDPATGKEQTTFTPVTLGDKWKTMLDENNLPVSWWPKDASGAPRFPTNLLLQKKQNNPYDFTCQYLLKPEVDPLMKAFPEDKIQVITLANYRLNVLPRIQHYTIGLDTAYTDHVRSNFSAFVICGWDASNRCYVREVIHRKLQPSDTVKLIFELNEKYKPLSFVIEETGYVSGLRVAIETELIKKREYYQQNRIPWNIDWIKVDNQKSKVERIRNTLQPLILEGRIRFVRPPYDRTDPLFNEEAMEAHEATLKELKIFPLPGPDDILDALADQFQPKTWFGRLGSRNLTDLPKDHFDRAARVFMGIEPEINNGKAFPVRPDGFLPPEFLIGPTLGRR